MGLSAALLPVATSAQLHLGAIDRWLPFGYAVLVAAGGFWTAYRRAGRTPDLVPFPAVTAAEIAGLVALVALYYPQIVPPSVTLYSSAASRETTRLPGHRDRRVHPAHDRLSRLLQLGFPRAPAAGRRRDPWRPSHRARRHASVAPPAAPSRLYPVRDPPEEAH